MSVVMDERRFEFEVRRAMAAMGMLSVRVGQVQLDVDGTELVVSIKGGYAPVEVARVPGHRLRAIAPERVEAMFDVAVDDYPPEEAAVLREARETLGIMVDDPPNEDWVTIGVDGVPLVTAHRCLLVDGWPAEDVPE